MRRVVAVTTSRADWGIYLPVLRAIQGDPELDLVLIVGGTHLSPLHGMTLNLIESDGFEISARVPLDLTSDSAPAIAQAMGDAVSGSAEALTELSPDLLLVLGDRYEMHAAALAALPLKIPVAHIHGGEVTEGAIDDALRHSMTKLSHLHFVTTEEHRRRVIQLGEEPWRVHVCGAPSLDNLRTMDLLTRDQIGERFGITLPPKFLLVTQHPVTLEYEQTEEQTHQLLSALARSGLPVLFTRANADTHGQIINRMIDVHVRSHSGSQVVDTLGTQGYFSVMSHATVMVGNSSSGLIEAASFELPVVNVGSRQRGRVRGGNVIDTPCRSEEVLGAIEHALSSGFRESLRGMANPYGDGNAAEVIVQVIRETELGPNLIVKRFHNLSQELS
jgi:UDP-hydrolysing UDP-N-acetyl-D-glucosamine 2-epimerase